MRIEQWLYKLPLLLRSLFRRGEVEQELDDELRYHHEKLVEQNLSRGMSVDEARRAARRAVGALETRKEECRDNWVVAAIDRLARDTRHAFRTLRRDLGFTIGVFGLLALGIGANVAVFSIVDGILLEPLAYEDPDRLVVVREAIPERDDGTRSVNALHYVEWLGCECFEDIALAEYVQELNLTGSDEPVRVPSLNVTPNAFSMLGVSAARGRTFVAEDAEPGANAVVISDALWQRQFGADPEILGSTIHLDGVESTIIGVLPPEFRYHAMHAMSGAVDIYRPWAVAPPRPWWSWSNNYSFTALARLADSVSYEAALAELNGIQAAIADQHFPSTSLRAAFVPLHEWVTGESRDGLLLLFAAVGAALLVACLNIANLMLVRATARSREAGVRAALGASRLAIFRGVLIESAVLALAGAVAGVGLAVAAVKVLTTIAQTSLPRVDEVAVDGTVLVAALVLATVCTIAFGLLPAWRMTRVDPQAALQAGGRSFTETAGRVRLRQALVSVEVAVSVTLLIIAGLLLMSFVRLGGVDRGFEPANVLTAAVGLPFAAYPQDEDRMRFYESMLEELRASPGILAAGVTSRLPLSGREFGATAIAEGRSVAPEDQPQVDYRFVSPGYLDAIGLPVLTGRPLDARDYWQRRALISERVASIVWPGRDPIGRRFHMGDGEHLFEVVGLVPDVPTEGLAADPRPIVYAPLTATGGIVYPGVSIAVRTAGDPATAAAVVRNAVQSIDPGLSVSRVRTMAEIERASLGERRFQLVLVTAFGGAALLIAALGTYSVLAYTLQTRMHEIAMRMALGAEPRKVALLMLGHGMRPVLVGLAAGLAAALLLGRFVSSLLYSVTPTDPATMTAVALVTLGAALLAALLPARRAARTSLLEALRYE